MKYLLILLLSGCSTLDLGTTFDNRVVCTAAKDKAYFVSLYGPLGVAATVNSGDAAAFCTTPFSTVETPIIDSGINLDNILPK